MFIQGSHFLESPGMSWNRAKCPGKSWKLMNFRKLWFTGIWNDDCCSSYLKYPVFEISSTFLCKMFWKLLKNVLESPANEWEPCHRLLKLSNCFQMQLYYHLRMQETPFYIVCVGLLIKKLSKHFGMCASY